MIKSYTELESMIGGIKQELADIKAGNVTPPTAPVADPVTPLEQLTFDWNKALETPIEQITDDNLKELGNVPREIVEDYHRMKAKEAEATQAEDFARAAEVVGCEDNLTNIINSDFVQNLTPEARTAIEADLKDDNKWKTTLLGLAAQAGVSAAPKAPEQTTPTASLLGTIPAKSAPAAAEPFASRADWAAAKADPRYKRDEVYRNQVELRAQAYVRAQREAR